jgi:hypothetical protein
MQVYVLVVLAEAAAAAVEVGVVEAAEAVEAVAPRGESAAFRRIDKNPTYFYDRIMGIVTEMVMFVIPLHHLFRILSMVPE